jgi:integrase
MAENITTYVYQSGFASHIKDYLAQRKLLGYGEKHTAYGLREFDKFCLENYPSHKVIDHELIMAWTTHASKGNPGTAENKCGVVNGLAKYMLRIGIDSCVTTGLTPKATKLFLPHIFTRAELQKIFSIIDTRKYQQVRQHQYILPVAFRLSYCCGLRPSEIVSIKREDVDFNTRTIKIHESKGRSRIVIMSQDLNSLCAKMDAILDGIAPERTHLIQYGERKYSTAMMSFMFMTTLRKYGIKTQNLSMRLYDLRHTFATHKIYEWTRTGKDINELLPYLSEYMGHSCIDSTLYYVHLAAEIYPEIKKLSPQWLLQGCEVPQ